MANSRHNRNQTFKKNQQLSTLLFAGDQIIIADTEDILQKAASKLYQIITAGIKSNNNRIWFNYFSTENKIDGI